MHSMQNVARQSVDVFGVAPNHEWRDDRVERGFGSGNRGVSKSLAPPDQTLIGLNFDQKNFEAGPRLARK
jgi:hypothetical protein